MSTTSAAASSRAEPVWDARFAKRFVLACGIVPGLLLVWDAWRGNLGVNDVNFAIRTTGLLGLVFLSLSLVITPLRRLTGWNALVAVRRNLGVYGFVYILAHFAIFVVYDRDGSISSTLSEIVAREYLWYGTAALVIMIPLAITSTDAMVSRLGAKRWKLLHRLAYLAVLGGVVHYYLLVKADVTKPVMFATVFGGLMLYRIGAHYVDLRRDLRVARDKLALARSASAPKKKFWSGELRVARVFDETPDVKTFRLVNPDGGPIPFEHVAGQYLNVALAIDGKRVNRSYTIASSPARTAYCEISVKRTRDGYASKHLHEHVREGSLLKVGAPAGKFVFAGHEAERIVLIAGGVGITPMMSVVRYLTDRAWTGDIYLVFSVRTHADVVFERELAYLQSRFPKLYVRMVVTAEQGRVTRSVIEELVPGPRRGPVMLCGPAPMMVAMRALLVDMGWPNDDVREEAFVSPTGSASDDAPLEAGEGAVEFRRSGRRVESPALTVLEAAEECGVDIPYECRSGICGQCKTKLVTGRVAMAVQDALTPSDKANGVILACQARPVRDVVVDA